MKKLITLLTVLVTLTTQAQWVRDSEFFIDFGPKVMVGPSLMNSNVSFDTTTNYKHKFNCYGFNYGVKLALNFGQHVSVVGEYVFTNNTQNFELDNGDVKQIKSKGYEIPLMLRHNNENFGYIEGGVVLGRTKTVTETYLGDVSDFTELYNTKNTGIVFGLGGYLFSMENFGISAGIRYRYDFVDFINQDNIKLDNSPVFALDSQVEKVNNMSLMFVLELNYDLGFAMARSACGDRRKVMFTSGRR